MRPDDEVCLCFHVTRRKVEQYLRHHRPAVASQLSECFGAGTGCGWCRPFLKRLHQQSMAAEPGLPTDAENGPPASHVAAEQDLPDAADYAAARSRYRDRRRENDD